jgi:glycosyltransferase involved in cell wall biosynthesis
MNNSPFFSVVINCFNGERYLRKALDSVLSQTFSDLEIIFWDNQSTDASLEIAKAYSNDRIHCFYAEKHTNLGDARNLAVEKTQGHWIAFLDCDDIWAKDKLQSQYDIIKKGDDKLGFIYSGYDIICGDADEHTSWGAGLKKSVRLIDAEQFPDGDIFSKLLQGNFIIFSTGVVRRDAFFAVGGIDPVLKQAEDYDLFLKLAKIYGAAVCRERLVGYRVHGDNLSAKQESSNFSEAIDIISKFALSSATTYGLKCHYNSWGIFHIRNLRLIRGVMIIITKGSLTNMAIRLFRLVVTYSRRWRSRGIEASSVLLLLP